MPSRSRFGAARTIEARLLTRLTFKLLTFGPSNTRMHRRTNRICNGRGRLGSFHGERRRDHLKHISIAYGG
jgi:hypothetical protein